ncbi:MAG TPA: hypothetical protein VMJ90_11040, partial [Anaerolineales bacterium]|nr:hypothetical protein [Anaerolineales bacterium]
SISICILALSPAACAPAVSQIQLPEEYRMPTEVLEAPALTQTVEAEIASKIPPADCPVTTTAMLPFEAPEPYSPVAPWEGIFWFGTEGLWTALHDDGVWAGLPLNPDGYTQKIMWWSDFYILADEPEPALVVSGRRLDGDAPALRFYGATNAMAKDIGEAMLTGVEFPTLGCWEVTGRYKKSGLTFVVWIAP